MKYETSETVEAEQTWIEKNREQILIRAWFRPGPTWAVWSVIALNVIYFGVQQNMSRAVGEQASILVLGGNVRDLTLGAGQWWRLAASMFLHYGLVHIAANMVSLYSLGGFLERLVGWGRFLAIYLGCGLFASMASLANPAVGHMGNGRPIYVMSVGASGAIFAVAGALMALKLKRPTNFPQKLAERLFRSLAKPVGIFIIGGIVWSILVRSLDLGLPQLDNFAHLGGLSAGILSMILWPARMRENINFQA